MPPRPKWTFKKIACALQQFADALEEQEKLEKEIEREKAAFTRQDNEVLDRAYYASGTDADGNDTYVFPEKELKDLYRRQRKERDALDEVSHDLSKHRKAINDKLEKFLDGLDKDLRSENTPESWHVENCVDVLTSSHLHFGHVNRDSLNRLIGQIGRRKMPNKAALELDFKLAGRKKTVATVKSARRKKK